jgi:hypothetical protein
MSCKCINLDGKHDNECVFHQKNPSNKIIIKYPEILKDTIRNQSRKIIIKYDRETLKNSKFQDEMDKTRNNKIVLPKDIYPNNSLTIEMKKIIKKELIGDIDYLDDAMEHYGEAYMASKSLFFESDEPQIGKTHAILSLTWLERFYWDRNPMIIVFNRESECSQLVQRFDGFNKHIKSIFVKYNIDMSYYRAAELIANVIPIVNEDQATLNICVDEKNGHIPIILGNQSRMDKLSSTIDSLKRTVNKKPVLIVDEIHSLITGVKDPNKKETIKFGAFSTSFYNIVESTISIGGRIIGVSATGFSAFASEKLSPIFECYVKVKQTKHYIKKNLKYLDFSYLTKIEKNWSNNVSNYSKMIKDNNDKELILSVLREFRDDEINVHKMLLCTLFRENNDQNNFGKFVENNFPDQFEIIIFNQESYKKECIGEILDKYIGTSKPIIIICKAKGTQGTTFKPCDLDKNMSVDKPLIGLTHSMIIISDSDHNEHIIQYVLRTNGQYPKDMDHPIKMYARKSDFIRVKQNLEAKKSLTDQLEEKSLINFTNNQNNNFRNICLELYFPNPGNKMTRDNSVDIKNTPINSDAIYFKNIDEYIVYLDSNQITAQQITDKILLSESLIDSESGKILADELLKGKYYQDGIGYKNVPRSLQNKIRDFYKTLMKKKDNNVKSSTTLQLSYYYDRMKTAEMFIEFQPDRYQSEYKALSPSFDISDELFVIKYTKTDNFIIDRWYSWERTDGSIGLLQYKGIKEKQNYCYLVEK